MITKRELERAIFKAGTQSALAIRLGVSRQYISQIMKADRPFPKRKVDELLNFLANG